MRDDFESEAPEFPGYNPEERQVFGYFDGQQDRMGDPFAVRRRLDAQLGNVNRVLQECHADYPPPQPVGWEKDWPPPDWHPPEAAVMDAAAARGRLVEAVRIAFEMAPFDPETGTGALESDCNEAFRAYSDFSQKKSPPPES